MILQLIKAYIVFTKSKKELDRIYGMDRIFCLSGRKAKSYHCCGIDFIFLCKRGYI